VTRGGLPRGRVLKDETAGTQISRVLSTSQERDVVACRLEVRGIDTPDNASWILLKQTSLDPADLKEK
jgi:hypothetical protein